MLDSSCKNTYGDGTTSHADVRRNGHYTCKGMVYAKMFYERMVLSSGGMASPLNSSTASREWTFFTPDLFFISLISFIAHRVF